MNRPGGLAAVLLLTACATGRGPGAMPSAAVASPSAAPAAPSPAVAATSSAETGASQPATTVAPAAGAVLFNDSHFHLLNYIQRGPTAREFLDMTAGRVGRVAMFGIPLQQKWDYFLSGDDAPDYYLSTNADLYYYSFVDAVIAREYLSLPEEDRRRVDPMITGFNPADMYASDHIERVLLTFPGVFAGIGEFSIHKEFVSSKVSGHAASLRNPALDRILAKAAEIGLVVIFHNDIDHVRPGDPPHHAAELLDLFARHPETTIIWAHTGLGRFIAPSEGHVARLDRMLSDPRHGHVALDISWDEVAKYVIHDDATLEAWATLIERHPTRFLFGTDAVAPAGWEGYVANYTVYAPLWERLAPGVRAQVERLNYERIFDAAIPRVRAWERRRLAGSGRD